LAEVRALARAGWQVTVLAPGASLYEPKGCRVVALGGEDLFGWPGALTKLREHPARALRLPGVLERGRRELRRLPVADLLVAHWLVPSAWPLLLGPPGGLDRLLSARGRVELVAHGSDVRLLLKLPRLVRDHILAQLAQPRVELRFVSLDLRDDLLNAAGLSSSLRRRLGEHSVVRPAALELPPLPSRLQARGQLGIREGERLVLVVGRLVPDKRVDVALGAAELVPHGRLVVLGSGPELASLRELFPTAEFLGQLPRTEALTWMCASDVLLSASRLEGAPTAIREARLLGIPVVSSRAGDLEAWAAGDSDLWLASD
jgi:glycosyltransferase involved in cell wall biosynthesis